MTVVQKSADEVYAEYEAEREKNAAKGSGSLQRVSADTEKRMVCRDAETYEGLQYAAEQGKPALPGRPRDWPVR